MYASQQMNYCLQVTMLIGNTISLVVPFRGIMISPKKFLMVTGVMGSLVPGSRRGR